MDVDDFINADEAVPTGGILSSEEIVAYVRDSQIDKLEENQESNVINPNVSTEVALDALNKLKIYLKQSIDLYFIEDNWFIIHLHFFADIHLNKKFLFDFFI